MIESMEKIEEMKTVVYLVEYLCTLETGEKIQVVIIEDGKQLTFYIAERYIKKIKDEIVEKVLLFERFRVKNITNPYQIVLNHHPY